MLAATAVAALLAAAAYRSPDTRGMAAPAAPVMTDTIFLFGPRQFETETGTAQIHMEQFPVSVVEGAVYTLRLANGAPDGTLRASSASVVLNGAEIITSSEVHTGVAELIRTVDLLADNSLEVTVAGVAGSHVTLSFFTDPVPEFTVYGPQQFQRSGKPTTVTDQFSIPPDAGPPYMIRVANGEPDGSDRVSSATVGLNGTEILSESDFGQSVAEIAEEVTLQTDNTLEVLVKNPNGSVMYVRFTATDTTAPVLTVTSPTEGATIDTTEVSVTGTIADVTPTNVTVNGHPATVVGNQSFSVTVPLPQEGANLLQVQAVDAAGNVSTQDVSVIRDTGVLSLTVTSPADGLVTADSLVTVSGTVSDSSATVTVNGIPLTVDATGAFSEPVSIVEGTNLLTISADDGAGQNVSEVRTVIRDTEPPLLTVVSPVDNDTTSADTVAVSGSVVDSTAVTVVANGMGLTVETDGSFAGSLPLVEGPNTITITATDAVGNQSGESRTVVREPDHVDLPPDPSTVAPPLDPTIPTTLFTATEFLYTSADPIQTGVAPGTIEPIRAAVLRGRVLSRDGAPLSGVEVSILNRPELGQTLSRADGMYDLVVNGGGIVTLDYSKTGYLGAQRQVELDWQEYEVLGEIRLIQRDTLATAIDFSDPIEVARGSPETDADGTRQATALFAQGTQATMRFPDGTTQPLSTLTVRATEATVGETGPEVMPAALPATSGYTYAVELTVDEATSAGATEVEFSQPVPFYIENFLGFPVGLDVPVGRYDYARAAWVPEPDGRVIEILGATGGLADVDADGDGLADSSSQLDSLGITDDERASLASLYGSGTSLWRAPLTHFSWIDLNYGWSIDGIPPNLLPWQDRVGRPCLTYRSIIECQNQVLGERVPVTGTPFTLNYRSDRATGRIADYAVEIPLTGDSVPSNLKQVLLEVSVAGRTLSDTFDLPLSPNMLHTFVWDGLDAYGRRVQGLQRIDVRVGHVYPFLYTVPADVANSFGLSCTDAVNGFADCLVPTSILSSARQEAPLWLGWVGAVGLHENTAAGLGGWSVDIHHAYDAATRTLFRGDGDRRAFEHEVVKTVAGSGAADPTGGGFAGDGGPATEARLDNPQHVDVAADGSYYISDRGNSRVRRVGPDGIITTALTLTDGFPSGIAVDRVGGLYVADNANDRVLRLNPTGTVDTIAGTGEAGFSGDGGLATQAQLNVPRGLALAPDGSLYIADSENYRVRRIAPDGIMATVAGNGAWGFSGDGGLATDAMMRSVFDVAVGPDGSLFIADWQNFRVRRVDPDGMITTYAGNGDLGFTGDGGPATEAAMDFPTGVDVAPDGSLNIAFGGSSGERVRRVTPDGIINTAAGSDFCCFAGDGGLATDAGFRRPYDVHVAPDGSLYVADSHSNRIRLVRLPLPEASSSTVPLIASEDGSEVYEFDTEGRHLRTFDAMTGSVRYQFAYDGSGRLSTVTDADGNVTTIERDAQGAPTAITAPFGQQTQLALNAAGYLASVTNPAGESVSFTYDSGGLLTGMTDARQNSFTFSYDGLGRLTRDEDPDGGFVDLARTTNTDEFTVTQTTALGRTTTYRVERLPGAAERRVNTDPNGLTSEVTLRPNALTTALFSDGTSVTVDQGSDPRFGVATPVLDTMRVATPGGLVARISATRNMTLADATDPLSLQTQTDSVVVNGRVYTNVYDAAIRRYTATTPEGRQSFGDLDTLGRAVRDSASGLAAVGYTYDGLGRLSQAAQGSRSWQYSYDAAGRLLSVTDPIARADSFFYDAADRLVRQVLPDGQEILFGYDADGNLTSLTPPGRPAHGFSYTAVDLTGSYDPPDLGPGVEATTYAYDADRQLTRITRPDSQTIDLGYDAGGRLGTITLPGGQLSYGYDPGTGNLSTVAGPYADTLALTYDGSLLTGVTWTGDVAGSLGAVYDSDFRIAETTVNGADTVAFTYDGDGLLTGAGALSVTRDPANGLITGTTLGSVTTSRSHTPFGEWSAYGAEFSSTSLLQTSYVRDDLGRITQLTETVEGTTTVYDYAYDAVGRLVEVKTDGLVTASYQYDANGNRLQFTGPGGSVAGSYDDQDRLLAYGSATYGYTAAGELERKVVGADTTAYAYDGVGNLTSVALPDGRVIGYVVDGFGRRVGKKLDGLLVQGLLYEDLLNPVAELDPSGQVVSRFVHATRGNVPDYMVKAGTTYRIVADHLGSVRLVVDAATGAVAQRIDYDAFGRVTQNTNPGFQPFGFAGGLYDEDAALVRFGARDYDAFTGRWTAKDPLDFAGGDWNLYGYALGDPINLIDSTGQVAVVPILVGAAAGYGFDYFLRQLKGRICTCSDPETPLGPIGNSALGAAEGLFGRFAPKRRGGVAGGGPAGAGTSVFSQINHWLADKGTYSDKTRHAVTRGGRLVSRLLLPVTTAAVGYQVYDALTCR